MKRLNLIVCGCALIFGGCSSTPKPKPNSPDHTLINIPRSVPGIALSNNDIGKLRTSETVEAYVFGRYVDPNDPSVMYEANTVYRVGNTPYWVRTPRPLSRPPTGVPVGLGSNPANRPLITEFKHDLQVLKKADSTMRSASQRLMNAEQNCNKLSEKLSKTLKILKITASKNEILQSQLTALEEKVSGMEAKKLFGVETGNQNETKSEKTSKH